MTDNDIRTKILDEYKNYINNKSLQIKLINDFIKEYNLDPCDARTHTKAIERLEIEFKKIAIPEQRGEKKIPVMPGESFVMIDNNIKYKIERLYDNYTEIEVRGLREKKDRLYFTIQYLTDLLNITELYSSRSWESNKKVKKERDTKSKKAVFIISYLKNSGTHKMETNKIIAELTKVSEPTISRYLADINNLEQIENELSEIYNSLVITKRNLEDADYIKSHELIKNSKQTENVEFNMIAMKRRIEKLNDKKRLKNFLESSRKSM